MYFFLHRKVPLARVFKKMSSSTSTTAAAYFPLLIGPDCSWGKEKGSFPAAGANRVEYVWSNVTGGYNFILVKDMSPEERLRNMKETSPAKGDEQGLCMYLELLSKRPGRGRLSPEEASSDLEYMDETASNSLCGAMDIATRLLPTNPLADKTLRILGGLWPVAANNSHGMWLCAPRGTRSALRALLGQIKARSSSASVIETQIKREH